MPFGFGTRSKLSLIDVHQDLVTVAQIAIGVTQVDFTVLEGRRTPERQALLYASGASKTMHSKHLIGHAIDVAAWVHGAISWDFPHYPAIASAFQQASRETGIQIVWGAIWDRQIASLTGDLGGEVLKYMARHKGKDFIDSGHFELRIDTGFDTA